MVGERKEVKEIREKGSYLASDLDYQCLLFPVILKLKNFSAPEVSETKHLGAAEIKKFRELLKTKNRLSVTAVIFEQGKPQVALVRFLATGADFDPENLFAFEMEKGGLLADLTLHVKDGQRVEVNLTRYASGFDIATGPVV